MYTIQQKNLHVTIEGQLNLLGIKVWAGLLCKGVLESIFFHTAVTHDLYLNMLRDNVLPQLQRQHDNDFFQQDGAPPHYAIIVHKFLDEQLPSRWIGQRGPVEWPPRSPDLIPMDSSFGVLLKSFHENHILWIIGFAAKDKHVKKLMTIKNSVPKCA